MTMKNFVTGEILTEGDLDIYCVNTIQAIKTATESVTSSTVLQNDDQLLLALAANSIYEVTGEILYDGSTAADIQVGFTGPAGASLFLKLSGLAFTAGGFDAPRIVPYTSFGAAEEFGALGAGTNVALGISGIVSIAGTAGNLQLQWAQDTSGGTATRVFANSYLVARRIS